MSGRPEVGGLRERSDRPSTEAGGSPRSTDRELIYRSGTFSAFLEDLLRGVRLEALSSGEHAGSRPLARLHVGAERSWLIGLLKAWSEVGDVFTFYQERIANEGFLRTATEEMSLREIVRLIDYVRFPGAGASTHLAFRVLDVLEMPRRVRLPVGTEVASVPAEAELPQEWETVEEIEARAEWNQLVPEPPSRELEAKLLGRALHADLAAEPAEVGPGAALLVLAGAKQERRFLRRVEKVERPDELPAWKPAARITWTEALLRDEPETVLRSIELLHLGREARLFGHDAPPWSELPDQQKEEISALLGGVVVSDRRAARGPGGWGSINQGLPDGEVTALTAGPEGRLFAGTPDGIFRQGPEGTWARSGRTLVGQRIECLTASGRSELLAGSAQSGVLRTADGEDWQALIGESAREPILLLGFFSRRPRSGRLPGAAVRALLPNGDSLVAATDHGVFAFDSRRDAWEGRNRGLPGYARKTGRAGVVVRSLVRGARPSDLFAGTDRGVFFSPDDGRRWRPRSAGLPGHDPETGLAEVKVTALIRFLSGRTRVDHLFAGTDRGVFRSTDGGESWHAASLGLPGTDYDTGLATADVRALASAHDPRSLDTVLFAGTAAGVFHSRDLGESWHAPGEELARRPVTALAVDGDGRLSAAVPRGGFALTDWPDFRPRRDRIDLAEVVTGIGPGDWVALVEESEEREPRVRVFRAAAVEQVVREDFGLSAAVTRIVPGEEIGDLESFDLRRARVLFGARALELFAGRRAELRPLERETIRLRDAPAGGFEGPRSVIVEGRRLRLSLGGERAHRVRTERGESVSVPADAALLQLAPPGRGRGRRAATGSFRVRLPGGEEAEIDPIPETLSWEPARADDPRVAELVTADWSTRFGGEVELALRRSLRELFDPWTVKIHGNVAEASQGRTVEEDVLGDGDSSRSFQRFALTVPPLTYLRTPTARGYGSTLEVRVSGARWREVESLAEAKTSERAFMVRPDLDGDAAVRFGDGRHGARVPSGVGNVVATYRTGMWAQALEPHSITLLRSKPLGLDGVTNPLAVAAGAPVESAEATRERAPLSVRTLGRVVSLEDYRDFCLSYPGVSKARVAALATSGGAVVQITVATQDGRPLVSGEGFHRQLLGAIEAARAEPAPTAVDSCRRVRFEVEAEVRLAADARPAQVAQRARRALRDRYSYANSRFDERVTAAELARLLQGVRGVGSVRLLRFHRSDRRPELEPYLVAAPGRWDERAGRTRGAELLEIREPGGLRLVFVGAT